MDSQILENGIVLQSFKLSSVQSNSNFSPVPQHVKNETRSKKRGKIRVGTPLPQHTANLLSFTSSYWLTPLIYQIARSQKEVLDDDAVWSAAPVDGCQENAKILGELWERELRKKGRKKASLFKCCVQFVGPMFWRLLLGSVFFALSLVILTVVVIRQMVRFLQHNEDLYFGFILTGAMLILNLAQISTFSYCCTLGKQYGTRLKGAVMYLAYEKALRLETFQKITVGVLVSMFAADSLRVFMAVYRLYTVSIFITILIATGSATAYLIGWWMLAGFGVFALMTLLQMFLTSLSATLQNQRMIHMDSRIQKMKEVLNSIRLIKMWAWEKPFLTEIIGVTTACLLSNGFYGLCDALQIQISHERKKETSKSKNQTFLTILGVCQIFQTPALATAITLTLYSYFGNTLNTELAFSVATTFSVMRYALMALPVYGRHFADILVSCRRIQDFLLRPDVKTETTVVSDDQLAVEMKKACFHWPSDLENGDRNKEISNAYSNPVMDEESDTEIDSASNVSKPNGVVTTKPNLGREPVLKNISFEAKKGSLIGICGPVGSGKSALVSALLGQMTQLEGSLAVNGTIAICPQEAWIFNDTLRENILFGSPYNKDRYEKTLDLTSLRTDVESFPVGDQTEIGDRGITLSGGQRQRLSLARALYSDRDIYLLDDPFSALDVTVGQQVFTRCIKQGLREKTVILTTHQLQYLQDCDLVIYLENGTVSEMGTHAELMEQAKEYSHMIKSFYEKTATKEVQPGEEQAQQSEKAVLHILDAEAGRLTEKESMGVGNVTWACYATYIRSLGGATAFLFLLFCFMLTEGIVFACDWWLSAWLQQVDSDDVKSGNSSLFQMDNVTVSPETEISDVMRSLTGVSTISISMDRSTFVLVYGIGIAILFLTNFSRSWILAKTTINSSHVLHKRVLAKVMSSPVSFFDSTPSGRIMNRFSADIDMLDTLIPMDLGACLMVFFRIMIAVGGIAAIFPLLLVSLVPAVIAVMIIGRLGRASSFQMKRMDNVTRSKLLDHVTSTAQGLVSVRTYEKENMFTKSTRRTQEYFTYTTPASIMMRRNRAEPRGNPRPSATCYLHTTCKEASKSWT